jgi:predicted RNA binding protein YcfA (HicA-like mRNA interferase family)
VFSTPNFDSLSVAIWGKEWTYIGGDDHIYLFGPKTLTRMLEGNGFRVVRVRTKGVHIALKDHTDKPRTLLLLPLGAVSTAAEKALDFIIRLTLKGHRLKVWAERV